MSHANANIIPTVFDIINNQRPTFPNNRIATSEAARLMGRSLGAPAAGTVIHGVAGFAIGWLASGAFISFQNGQLGVALLQGIPAVAIQVFGGGDNPEQVKSHWAGIGTGVAMKLLLRSLLGADGVLV